MYLISHRGNLSGIEKNNENNPDYINQAISRGYDVEVDVRYESGQFFLGHDFNQYPIEFAWLEENSEKLWIHCKDFFALNHLMNITSDLNYFWHESDKVIFTSKGYIWTYPNSNFYSNKSVNVDLGKHIKKQNCYGVCSDYVQNLIIL